MQANKEAFEKSYLNQSQILLELTFSHLLRNDVQAAHACLDGFELSKSTTLKNTLKKQQHDECVEEMKNLLDAYLGLIESTMVMQEYTETDLTRYKVLELYERSKAAMSKMVEVVDEPDNCWDAFVLGLIRMNDLRMELLKRSKTEEKDKEFDEMVGKSLEKYSVVHRNNPNAHKYLLKYLYSKSKTNEDVNKDEVTSKIKDALQRLQEICPSDEECFKLHQLLRSESEGDRDLVKLRESYEVLMSMLDCQEYKFDESKWRHLLDCLKWDKQNLKEILQTCWVDQVGRKRVWASWHFTKIWCEELLPVKMEVYKILKEY